MCLYVRTGDRVGEMKTVDSGSVGLSRKCPNSETLAVLVADSLWQGDNPCLSLQSLLSFDLQPTTAVVGLAGL